MEFDENRVAMQAAMMELENTAQPVLEGARRVKEDFVSHGWSPGNAELAALIWLRGVLGVAG